MAEVLSREEIKRLLAAVNTGAADKEGMRGLEINPYGFFAQNATFHHDPGNISLWDKRRKGVTMRIDYTRQRAGKEVCFLRT